MNDHIPAKAQTLCMSLIPAKDIDLMHHLFQNVKYKVSTAHSMEGDIGGCHAGMFGRKLATTIP